VVQWLVVRIMQPLNDHSSYNDIKVTNAKKINRVVFGKNGFILLAIDSKGSVTELTA
jgi:hypothetical protein